MLIYFTFVCFKNVHTRYTEKKEEKTIQKLGRGGGGDLSVPIISHKKYYAKNSEINQFCFLFNFYVVYKYF